MAQDFDEKDTQDTVNATAMPLSKGMYDESDDVYDGGQGASDQSDGALQDEEQPQTDEIQKSFDGTARQTDTIAQKNAATKSNAVTDTYPQKSAQADTHSRTKRNDGNRARKPDKRKRQTPFWKTMPQSNDESIPKRQLLPFVIMLSVLAVILIVLTVVGAMPTAARLTFTAVAAALGFGWILYSALRK